MFPSQGKTPGLKLSCYALPAMLLRPLDGGSAQGGKSE